MDAKDNLERIDIINITKSPQRRSKHFQNIDPLDNLKNLSDIDCHAQDQCILSNSPSSPINQPSRGLCHCCLQLTCFKSLWQTYEWMGGSEMYGVMLQECFGFDLSDQPNAKICEVCITQLRYATRFKEQVTRCQKHLQERGDTNDDWKIVTQSKSVKDEIKAENIADSDDPEESFGYDDSIQHSLPAQPKNGCDVSNTKKDGKNDDTSQDARKDILNKVAKVKSRKKRLKNHKKIILLKNTSKIDRRTIAFQSTRFIEPRRNVGLLLEHSTICPFKYSQAYFKCFYCSKNHLVFEDLRSHVKDCHDNLVFKDIVKCITRPNDQIKVDVSDLTCRTCHRKCINLDELAKHLTEAHSVKFNGNPGDSILGYDLADNKFKCTVCKEVFLFFKTLGKHMNQHSTNHVCDVCGKCFLLIERLRAHVTLHSEVGNVKCDHCDKMFPSKQTLNSHVNYVHKRKPYSCSICTESFPTYRKRLQHFVERHGRAPLSVPCEQCGKTFRSNGNLTHHVRHQHEMVPKEAKFSCEECGRKFTSKRVLTDHMLVHSGEKKYECDVCKKKFGRHNSLKEHLKIHKNDKRWSCGACAVCFVQKCSLKNHIRVHHAEYDLVDLIVFKDPNK